MRTWLRRGKSEIFPLVLLIGAVSMLFGLVLFRLLSTGQETDYTAHLDAAMVTLQTGELLSPHFLYEILVILAHKLLHINLYTSGFLISLFSYILLAIELYVFLRRSATVSPLAAHARVYRGFTSTTATLLLMFAAPITILTWPERHVYFGYIGINVYHNPTILLLKPLALLLFLYALRVFPSEGQSCGRLPMVLVLQL